MIRTLCLVYVLSTPFLAYFVLGWSVEEMLSFSQWTNLHMLWAAMLGVAGTCLFVYTMAKIDEWERQKEKKKEQEKYGNL